MLLLVGFNHRSAAVSLRERLVVAEDDVPRALEQLRAAGGTVEGLILSTCNRTEVLTRVEGNDVAAGLAGIRRFFTERGKLEADEIERHSYHFCGRDAVRHLFRVASGLDSMILGEPQILGQVKQAYRMAREAGSTGQVLDRLMQQCMATAKKVRTETGISRHVVSVAYAAVNLAAQIFGDLTGRKVLLIGSGKMSDLVARHLASNGVGQISVTSRTYNRAVVLAERFQGRALPWNDGLTALGEADIVVTCTGAPQPVVTREMLTAALKVRRGRPLFLIDIAVPRDVDPTVRDMDNVYLYDIDGLQRVVDANLGQRKAAAADALQRINRDVEGFDRWRRTQAVAPTLVALREQLLEVGRSEVERRRRRLGPLSDEQQAAVDELTRAVIRKILHAPVVWLRDSVRRGDVDESVAACRGMFDIAEGDPPQPAGDDASDGATEAPKGGSRPPGPSRVLRGGKDSSR